MKGDEWRKGMENEALNVEDGAWAAAARLAARRRALRHNIFSFLAALTALEVLALLMAARMASAVLDRAPILSSGGLSNGLVTSLIALEMAYLLGRLRCLPAPVALGFALFPVLNWLTTTAIFVPLAVTDAVPTLPLQSEFSLFGLITLLTRAALSYYGTQLGFRGVFEQRITSRGNV